MSQDVSTNQGVREPLTVPPPIQPWSAEGEADKLMDELFSDIDRILDGGSKLPTEPVKPEYVSLQPIVIPKITIPSAALQPQELLQQPNSEVSETHAIEPLETEIVHTPNPRANRFSWSFEKLLLAVGLASLVVTILLLLTNNHKRIWPWSQSPGASQAPANQQLSDSDAQFASYVLRALDVIDRKTKAKQQTPSAPGATGTTNPPTIPAPSNQTLNSNQAPTVLEKIYIPVPQGQMPLAPSGLPPAARPGLPAPAGVPRPAALAPTGAARPGLPAPAGAVRLPAPAPARVARPTAPASPQAARPARPASPQAARPTAPASPQAARPARPASPQAARPARPASPQAARPAAPASTQAARPTAPASTQAVAPAQAPPPAIPSLPVEQAAASAANHTVVGLVEIGDRPVALINISGIVQRVNVGEVIGNSGWTLVSIGNQAAVIRRNGEVRSVYAGQKF